MNIKIEKYLNNLCIFMYSILFFWELQAILRYNAIFETVPLTSFCNMHYAIKSTWPMEIMMCFHNSRKVNENHYAFFPKVIVWSINLYTEKVIQKCSIRKNLLKSSQNSEKKHLCQSLLFNKVACLSLYFY